MTEPLMETLKIEFTIPGRPQQQGSKSRMPNGYFRDDNAKLEAWRVDAIHSAQAAYDGPKIMTAVFVGARFFFGRPAAHYGTGRNATRLKPSAPVFYAQAPDLDKLLRALGDVLTYAGVIQDDRLIVRWSNPMKHWTTGAPRTEVSIMLAEDGDDR